MNAIEAYHSNYTRTKPIARERLPVYTSHGEEAPPPRNLELDGSEPAPVTARSARRRRLWNSGTLVLESEGLVVGPIDKTLTTKSVHSSPRREPETLHLRPEQELVFVPSGPEETSGEFPPLRVHRCRQVVRVRPRTAGQYGDLYRLIAAAESRPQAVGEDLQARTWALVYGSIEAAKRAERRLGEARRLATG